MSDGNNQSATNAKRSEKLDRVSPVDNTPSNNLLHPFVQFFCLSTIFSDTWHVTYDTWRIVCQEHSLKISAP